MHRDGNSSFWLTRPLPPKLIQYAATDIQLVSLTHDFFLSKRFITATNYTLLLQKTMRYISYYDSREEKLHEAVHPDVGVLLKRLLPLDVIHEPEPKQYQCCMCLRMLNLCCFETLSTAPTGRVLRGSGKKKAAPNNAVAPPSHRRPCCRICAITAISREMIIPMDWLVI